MDGVGYHALGVLALGRSRSVARWGPPSGVKWTHLPDPRLALLSGRPEEFPIRALPEPWMTVPPSHTAPMFGRSRAVVPYERRARV